MLILLLLSLARGHHPSETMRHETAALSFYATDLHYLCASIANGVIQNRCAHALDVVIHYSGPYLSPKSHKVPTSVPFGNGATLYVRHVSHQAAISNSNYRNSLDKFTAMSAEGYNYTILIDADQLILRDLWYLVNQHIRYDVACVGFNLAALDHIGTLPTLIVTHNYPQIRDVPAQSSLKNAPDGNTFDHWMKRKQFYKMILPAEVMCYSYDKTSGCADSYLLHFSHGGKPWSSSGRDISQRLKRVWSAFGDSVRQCVKTGSIDLHQRDLLAAMNSFADTRLHCTPSLDR